MNILKNGTRPDSNAIYPIAGYDKEIYVKPTITNPNIIVGDFAYIADSEFESHVTHHDDFLYHRGYELVVSFPRATSRS